MSDSTSASSANLAYISVIAIWATTPLAIQWSNDSLSPITAVSGRMLLATVLGLLIAFTLARRFPLKRQNVKLYFAASLGLFPNMPLVYLAAQYIPSGWISLLFALSPFAVGLCSILVLGDNPFNGLRIVALCAAVGGLGFIFAEQLQLDWHVLPGILLMLLSVTLFSLSSVWVKKLSANVHAFEQTLGALTFCLPGMLLCWLLADGQLPESISLKSGLSLLYLATFGSLIGFLSYFHVVQRLSVTALSVIPLTTPVFALLLGHWLNGEPISQGVVLGTVIIISALAVYQGNLLRAIGYALLRKV